MKLFATLLSLLVLSQSASAFSLVRLGAAARMIQIEVQEEACLENAYTQSAMGNCIATSNTGYKEALADVSAEILSAHPEVVLEMADSERTWAALVKVACALDSLSEAGGTNQVLIQTNCENEQIAARIEQLVEYYEGL